MTNQDDEIEATARKLAQDKARLDQLGEQADALEKEVEGSKPPPNQGWKGDVAP
jgi:hypothetical protein